jgi:hypothetical protein
MRRSHVIYLQKSPAKTKTQYVKKDRTDGLRHSTTPKSPRGAALTILACDTPRKSRLRVQPEQHNKCAKSKFFPKDSPCKSHLRVQPEQHNKCAKSKSFPKDSPCKSRLRVQPEQHNKCAKSKSFPKDSPSKSRLRVQPKQHNKYVKIEVFHKRLRAEVAYGCGRINEGARLIIQITVTYTQRGHHILHWLNLRDDTHLPVVEQHYPQFLTLKKISQLPFTYTRPNQRGQQFSFTSPIHAKTTTLHLITMTPTTSRQFTHSPFHHLPSPPIPSTRTREPLGTLHARRRLRCSHI